MLTSSRGHTEANLNISAWRLLRLASLCMTPEFSKMHSEAGVDTESLNYPTAQWRNQGNLDFCGWINSEGVFRKASHHRSPGPVVCL